jgi:hypothetical protein
MADGSKRAELQLDRQAGGNTIRVTGLAVDPDRNSVTGETTLPSSYIGEQVVLRLLYAGQSVPLSPHAVALQRFVQTTADLGAEPGTQQWTAALDAYLTGVANRAQDLYLKELIVLTHESATPLETVPLHSYLGVGQIVYFQVGARVIERAAVAGLVSAWSFAGDAAGADEYATTFRRRFDEYKRLGDEVAARHFTNSDINLPGQGARFRRGQIELDDQRMIPTIGPVPGGVPSDKALVVYVDSWRRTDADFQQSMKNVTVGDTFERQTGRVLMGVQGGSDQPIDIDTVRPAFKRQLNQPVPTPNGARLTKGTNAVVLSVPDVQPADVIQLFWAWKPAP